MTRTFSVVVVVLVAGALAMGQAEGRSSDRIELFGGFSWLSQDLSLTNESGVGPIGWNASAKFSAWRSLGMVVDFSGYYPGANPGCGGCGQHAKIHTFLVGPQVSVTRGRVTPFARFLLGETHMSTHIDDLPNYVTFTSNNSFAFGAGGGIEIKLNRRLSWRGQVDWLHNGFSTSDNQRTNEEVHNLARLSTGIVIRF